MKKIYKIFFALSIFFIYGCGTSTTEPILETTPETECSSDEDCWCRSFTGAEFIKGKVTSICCTEENTATAQRICPKINRCAQCIYE